MNRRSFLGAVVYGGFVWVASRLPGNRYGAVFRVVKIDPDGSGADYSGHLGAYVYNAQRCCPNCSVVFAAWTSGGDVEDGPSFAHGELSPVNGPAREIHATCQAAWDRASMGRADFALAG